MADRIALAFRVFDIDDDGVITRVDPPPHPPDAPKSEFLSIMALVTRLSCPEYASLSPDAFNEALHSFTTYVFDDLRSEGAQAVSPERFATVAVKSPAIVETFRLDCSGYRREKWR
jgi:hypothetical protein